MDKELEFIESIYDEADEQIKEVYREQKKNRDELLQEIAMIMLIYTVLDSLMSLSRVDKVKEYNKLFKLIKKAIKGETNLQESVITNILTDTVDKSFNHYSYNADLKDVRRIIEDNFKGKHFSDRVWENEKQVAERLHKQVNDFLNGKINVNQIKKDIEKTYNNGAYNTKRLVETEVARCSSNAFDRFCIETGVKKVRYNATLDSKLCDDCAQYHDKVFDFKDKIEVPRHPLCRCFYDIVDEDYKGKSKVDDEVAATKVSTNRKGKPGRKDFTIKKDTPLIFNNKPSKFYIKQGNKVMNVEIIAGKGVVRQIDDIERIVKTYTKSNGAITKHDDWQKVKGITIITDGNNQERKEVHWYECKDIGKVEWKIKPRGEKNEG